MKRFLIALFLVLFSFNAYGLDFFNATDLTGGGSGALDAIDVTNDGIDNGDKAVACTSTDCYFYHFNSSSGAAESSPDVIKPDNDGGAAYAGNGRWILVDVQADEFEAASGVSINEFSSDGTLAGNSDTAIPTEKAVKTYSDTKTVDTDFPGFLIRAQIDHVDDDTVTINPGVYHHQGTTEWFVYWDSAITFDVGSAGSNALSDDLGASEWHYIYLDDTAIVTQAAALLDADCFLNDTTAPTWSAAKHGWYNGNDRCIGAFYSDADSDILEYFHAGDLVLFAKQIQDVTAQDVDNSWVDAESGFTIPTFTKRALVTFRADGSATGKFSWRTNGQTAGTGHEVVRVESTTTVHYNTTFVITDSSQLIELICDTSNADTVSVYTDGWYYPIGM
ncbi:MAG: hypothetical protein ACYTFW_26405 [Planctomycetota bacterium]|jgi:hypothetical protein